MDCFDSAKKLIKKKKKKKNYKYNLLGTFYGNSMIAACSDSLVVCPVESRYMSIEHISGVPATGLSDCLVLKENNLDM